MHHQRGDGRRVLQEEGGGRDRLTFETFGGIDSSCMLCSADILFPLVPSLPHGSARPVSEVGFERKPEWKEQRGRKVDSRHLGCSTLSCVFRGSFQPSL